MPHLPLRSLLAGSAAAIVLTAVPVHATSPDTRVGQFRQFTTLTEGLANAFSASQVILSLGGSAGVAGRLSAPSRRWPSPGDRFGVSVLR